MKLTVVIVNYNVRYFLEQCLLSVQKAVQGMEAEVYVVDNNSVDGSVTMVQERFSWVHCIANKENGGFSKANNQAMRLAHGEYVLLLNPDTVVEEDTFRKVIEFMDEHPDAGGLGVKMVDGKGVFLPESKRGLPSPETSFYKIFGISKLFPRSARFNRYHLGHLSNDETHEIEILSGAFMLMRKQALDKVGLLDEEFFMYGEDVDLSWRIILGGWKNYYYPGTRIIHYKGESTKKGSLNYVFVFYNAMAIFARKHFSQKHAATYSAIIKMAIWMRAFVAVLSRFIKRISLPLLDAGLLYASMVTIKNYYAVTQHKIYDATLVLPAFISYIAVWMMAVWLSGGYDRPLKPLRALKPIVIGAAVILIAYSLLPEHLRFSRALILLAMLDAMLVFVLNRTIWNLLTRRTTGWFEKTEGNVVIVGGKAEVGRVKQMLEQIQRTTMHVLEIHRDSEGNAANEHSLINLEEIIRVHQIDQIVFCAHDMTSSEIIATMSSVSDKRVEFKIAPPESLYIIGSGSIESTGDGSMLDVNSVQLPGNRRKKRLLDFMVSVLFLLLSPLIMIIQKQPFSFYANLLSVISGRRTWVGYSSSIKEQTHLPRLKAGVIKTTRSNDAAHCRKMDVLYAKDFRVSNDLRLIAANFSYLGS
jgi:GT2 family glycosyltransferase